MKKLTIIGILLLLFAILIVFTISSQAFNNVGGLSTLSVTVPANSVESLQIVLLNSTILNLIYVTNGSTVNYYLVNQSGYSYIAPYMNSTARFNSHSRNLVGHGALEIINNSTSGSLPYQQGNSSIIAYQANASTIFQGGDYYMLFENPSNSLNVTVSTQISKQQVATNTPLFQSVVFWLIGGVMFIGGLVLILYSLFLGGRSSKNDLSDEEINKIYATYEKKRPKPRRRVRPVGRKGKRRAKK